MTDTLPVSAKAREAAKALNLELGGPDSPQDGTDLTIDGITALAFTRFERDVTAPLIEALDDLQQAEAEYRMMHDRHGDGSCAAGRAWDLMRRAGDKARAALEQARDQ